MTETQIMQKNKIEEKQQCDEIINEGFLFLDTLFRENDWYSFINETGHIAYTRAIFETEYFEIKIDKSKIYVSVPIQNSNYQYKTSFGDFSQATKYVETYFKQYII